MLADDVVIGGTTLVVALDVSVVADDVVTGASTLVVAWDA